MEDPDPEGFYLLSIFTSPVMIMASKAIIMIMTVTLCAIFKALETAIKELSGKRKVKTPSQENGIDHLGHLLKEPEKIRYTVQFVQNVLKAAMFTQLAHILWEPLQGNIESIEFFFLLFACMLIANWASKWVVLLLPVREHILKDPRYSNLLLLSQQVLSPLTLQLLKWHRKWKKRLRDKRFLAASTKESINNNHDFSQIAETFSNTSVRQIMRSRMDITAFSIDLEFQELVDRINKFGFSRIPVFRDTIDKVEGILYLKDLLPYIGRTSDFPWQNLLRPAYFVPENKKIDELLKEFQEKHVHMALVVDGYGGISGLITLEDILEEIVGEINDELDEVDLHYVKLDNNTYIFEGKTSLNDFCKTLEIEMETFNEVKGDAESIGGLLLQLNSNLPKKGDRINFKNFVFKIESANNKRVKKVRVLIKQDVVINQDADA